MEVQEQSSHAEYAEQAYYERLCQLANKEPVIINQKSFLNEEDLDHRFTAALSVLINQLADEEKSIHKLDRTVLDHYISQLDNTISQHLDEIFHHYDFQQLESTWRSLYGLVEATNFNANVRISLLDVDKETLRDDFKNNLDLVQTGLYQQVYVKEYDTPGGEPFSAIISDYTFDSSADDIDMLSHLGETAMIAHCPFIGSVNENFFLKNSMNDVMAIDDLDHYMERAEYIRWSSFRQTPQARYVGLTLPKVLLRLPYGNDNPTRAFLYQEQVASSDYDHFVWGNASFAFASNLIKSFTEHGWTVNIRGLESGGKVAGLPLHHYDYGRGLQTKIPTQVIISETQEMALANQGFIPLSYYKNTDHACFFSANSTQQPKIFQQHDLTANSRINARLPYVLLVSRIGHYLKVLQRENIGTSKSPLDLENELNYWLQSLVTKMNNPSTELISQYPLREGRVQVIPHPDSPGHYRIELQVMPHFQVEGMDIRLSLLAQYPACDMTPYT